MSDIPAGVALIWGVILGVWLAVSYAMLRRFLDGRRIRRHQREHRPRSGVLERADGSEIPLRFIETSTANVFLAVSQDGDRVSPEFGDEVRFDTICAGQSIVFEPPTSADS